MATGACRNHYCGGRQIGARKDFDDVCLWICRDLWGADVVETTELVADVLIFRTILHHDSGDTYAALQNLSRSLQACWSFSGHCFLDLIANHHAFLLFDYPLHEEIYAPCDGSEGCN